MSEKTQLERLATPFPKSFVSTLPSTGKRPPIDYVDHATVTESLLAVVGPFDFSVAPVYSEGKIAGALGTLTVTVDGRPTTITEVGDLEGGANDPGGMLKNAASDALKRCAMRLGLGLHLWCKTDYVLHKRLQAAREAAQAQSATDTPDGPEAGTGEAS